MTVLFRCLAFLLGLAILILSLQPPTGLGGPLHADKLQHLLAYGTLTGLMALGWPGVTLFRLVLLAALFGAGVEIAQGLSGLGRTPSVLDALANLTGACLVALALHFWRRRA